MKKKLPAFTLTELLVVLVIIGILVLIALPKMNKLVTKSKATEAKTNLTHLYSLQETYFMEHSKYTTDLEELGFEQARLHDEGGNAKYRFHISSADNTSFEAIAEAVVDFDQDGTYNKWTINEKQELIEAVKD